LFTLDVFVPSGGILLFCSGILAIISVVFAFQSSVNAGLIMLMVDFATIPVLVWVFLKIWPHTPIGRRVLLKPQKTTAASERDELKALVGKVVINRWPLLPTGQIQVDHKRYNAQSFDGKPIEAGCRVKVLEIRERMLVVAETVETLSEPSQRIASSSPDKPLPEPSPQSLLDMPAEQLGLDRLDE
jgi:membrane-bound ClpP family serine protease